MHWMARIKRNELVSHDVISVAHLATNGRERSWKGGGARAAAAHRS
jgi:hypothetical protein